MPLATHPQSFYAIATNPHPESALRFDAGLSVVDEGVARAVAEHVRRRGVEFGTSVIAGAIEIQAARLGFQLKTNVLRDGVANYDPRAKRTVFGEVLSLQSGVVAVEIQEPARDGPYHSRHASDVPDVAYSDWTICVYGIGSDAALDWSTRFQAELSEMFSVEFTPRYKHERVESLRSNTSTDIDFPLSDLDAAQTLTRSRPRELALDLARASAMRLDPSGDPEISELLRAGIVKNDPVSGRAFISDLGRTILAGSNWMTVAFCDALRRSGVTSNDILVNVLDRGHETDVFFSVCGELVMVELKADRFSMGHAYSFGAKIRFYRPDHALVVTCDVLDTDARVHLEESRPAPPPNAGWFVGFKDDPVDSSYANLQIAERVEDLGPTVAGLVETIRLRHAAASLERILSTASLVPIDVLNGLAKTLDQDRV